jgi:molybdate-binding protein/DNA-binding transcriptional regulator YhcF (GntR family)
MSLAKEISADIKQSILDGSLKAGDHLPSVREMAGRWECAPGTVQRAYRELAAQGFIITQIGQGTRVASHSTPDSLRRATLVHQIEAYWLELWGRGYTAQEMEDAMREVLARWQARMAELNEPPRRPLRFVGSHDPIVSLIDGRFHTIAPDYQFSVTFAGSMDGLLALARHNADIAGCHLWDAESNSYNEPFIHRLLPGQSVVLLTLAHRRLGLITLAGNPRQIDDLPDLLRPGVRFINRQAGAGTRVWLETRCQQLGLNTALILGYEQTVNTHLQVASAVAEGLADVGLPALRFRQMRGCGRG